MAIDLYGVGSTWFDLDGTTRDSLRNLVQYNLCAGYMAGGLNALVGSGHVTWPIPVLDSALLDTTTSSQRNVNPAPVLAADELLFNVSPNPSSGELNIVVSKAGTFTIYTVEGQLIRTYTLIEGNTQVQLPLNLATGLYMGVYHPNDNSKQKVARFVYQP